MKKKICVISFDHWGYDHNIVESLKEKGIESVHIKIGNFKHKNFFHKLKNSLFKIFLNKNPKNKKRQDYIIDTLNRIGKQDQILVISPETIELEYHIKIKKFTSRYIAYLCDSSNRAPIEHLLKNVFDEIYSFDKEDVSRYAFKETTNYNYINSSPYTKNNTIKNDVVYLASFDNRMDKLFDFSEELKKLTLSYRFIIAGKKASLFKVKKFFNPKLKVFEFSRKTFNQSELHQLYLESKVTIDLVRNNQAGLSFRVFEAMAFEKKLITNNKYIKNYNFYNPNNILVIENNHVFEKTFFEMPYEPIPQAIFKQYTIDSWVEHIFFKSF